MTREPRMIQCFESSWPITRVFCKEHGPQTKRLSNAMAQSLESYTYASSATRHCSLIAAAHLSPAEEASFSRVFLGADVDGDGLISRDEIIDALDDVDRSWWDPKVDINA